MTDIAPLGKGIAVRPDGDTIVGSFALSEAMDGWIMERAEVDETGYFITITWKRVKDEEGTDKATPAEAAPQGGS